MLSILYLLHFLYFLYFLSALYFRAPLRQHNHHGFPVDRTSLLPEGSMLDTRRQLLRSAVSLAAFFSISSRLFAEQHPNPIPSPNAPNPAYPQGMNGPGPKEPDQKAIDKQNQQEIRADVDKMYALVTDLKQELGLTNTTTVLSVSFVKKAHEVEKLAKHVKDLAKG
jgi:hypothetical protein